MGEEKLYQELPPPPMTVMGVQVTAQQVVNVEDEGQCEGPKDDTEETSDDANNRSYVLPLPPRRAYLQNAVAALNGTSVALVVTISAGKNAGRSAESEEEEQEEGGDASKHCKL
ncbi:hypothetical protein D9615_005957 [Tricholomella constricta]|uniref:Uncharacterized protein n=1 Tax=Tricholomella constricta TaxID=117010 RepID=A0A8H5M339_9AGAR|nr:hypothetical protein D9615_005957 [Tricholomella constricta]